MHTVFFVDTKPKVAEEWQKSSHNSAYPACPFTPFSEVAETAKLVTDLQPDFVVIAPLLGSQRGMNVFLNLRVRGCTVGRFMINAPLGSRTDVQCTPDELRKMLDGSIRTSPLPFRASKPAPFPQRIQPLPAAPELKKAIIGPDGWVRCPHTTGGLQCSGEQYVDDDAGERRCGTCFRTFLAVTAQEDTVSTEELRKATAINIYGDVYCPHCNWLNYDIAAGGKPVTASCGGCHRKFLAEPKTASKTA